MLSAGICCYLVMGKKQSPLLILALSLLFVSALFFQGMFTTASTSVTTTSDANASLSSKKKQCASKIVSMKPLHMINHYQQYFAKGIAPCLSASFLSGLAGAFSQKGLQVVGGTGRNAYLYTAEVSFFSSLFLLPPVFLSRRRNDEGSGCFAFWTWQTLIPICVKALGGVLTALVHKHAGSVLKGFSMVFGLLLSGAYQCIWERQPMTSEQLVGTILVMFSTWIHLSNPPSSS